MLYRILAPALANPKYVYFSEIRPSPAPAKFLAGFAKFGRCQMQMQMAVPLVNLIKYKT